MAKDILSVSTAMPAPHDVNEELFMDTESLLKWSLSRYPTEETLEKLVQHTNSKEVEVLKDALANRNFEKLKESSKAIGLGVLHGSAAANGAITPEFDLYEVAAVFDAEPYVRTSITRQLNLWFKEPFTFMHPKEEVSDYINQRFREMAIASGFPTLELFKQISRDLLKFSNSFVIKIRNEDLAGRGKNKDGQPIPIAGYFPVSPLNILPHFKNGKLVAYERFLPGTESRVINKKDVIHFTLDLEPDFLFGKPRTLGAVEDISALRRIEENVEIQLVKYLFPLLLFKVGTENKPAKYRPDGISEIAIARAMIENMDPDGVIIGTERHNIESIGLKNSMMDASNYIKHFKTRVLTALGVSALDLGEGDSATQATADNISQNLKERVMDDRRSFSEQVKIKMVAELILEHPDDLNVSTTLRDLDLFFEEVDQDTRIKKQSHINNIWNSDLLTRTEARKEMGKLPLSRQDELDTRFNIVDMPALIISAVDEPFTPGAKKALSARTKEVATGTALPEAKPPKAKLGTGNRAGGRPAGAKARSGTSSSRSTKQTTNPTNQHGTNPGPTRARSSLEFDLLGPVLIQFIDDTIYKKEEEIEDCVNNYFADNPTQTDALLKLMSGLEWDKVELEDRRSALIAELVTIVDKFKEVSTDD